MSKEDRYAHLGEQADDEQTNDGPAADGAAEDTGTDEIHVSVSDGSETVEVTVDDPDVSLADVEDAVERVDTDGAVGDGNAEEPASDGVASTAVERGVRASTFVPRMVLQSSSRSLTRGLELLSTSRTRDRED